MSGGFPPWTAVETICGTLSPAPVYLIFTPGFAFLNGASTASNDFCSSPVHLAMIETEPLTPLVLWAPPAVPATTSATVASATRPTRYQRILIKHLLLALRRGRYPSLFRGRRSGARACRPPAPRCPLHLRASAR